MPITRLLLQYGRLKKLISATHPFQLLQKKTLKKKERAEKVGKGIRTSTVWAYCQPTSSKTIKYKKPYCR